MSRRKVNNWHPIKGQPLTELDKHIMYLQNKNLVKSNFFSVLYMIIIVFRSFAILTLFLVKRMNSE